MVSMGLVVWVPVASAGCKRILWIRNFTVSFFMYMKSKRPHGLFPVGRRPVRWKSVDICTDNDAYGNVPECNNTSYVRIIRPSPYNGVCAVIST